MRWASAAVPAPAAPALGGITLLAVIAKLVCSVLSNRMTSHMQVNGLEAQCGFMPGKSTIDAVFTMRVSLQKRFRFQKNTWVLFVVFGKAVLMMELPRRHSTPLEGGRFAPSAFCRLC